MPLATSVFLECLEKGSNDVMDVARQASRISPAYREAGLPPIKTAH